MPLANIDRSSVAPLAPLDSVQRKLQPRAARLHIPERFNLQRLSPSNIERRHILRSLCLDILSGADKLARPDTFESWFRLVRFRLRNWSSFDENDRNTRSYVIDVLSFVASSTPLDSELACNARGVAVYALGQRDRPGDVVESLACVAEANPERFLRSLAFGYTKGRVREPSRNGRRRARLRTVVVNKLRSAGFPTKNAYVGGATIWKRCRLAQRVFRRDRNRRCTLKREIERCGSKEEIVDSIMSGNFRRWLGSFVDEKKRSDRIRCRLLRHGVRLAESRIGELSRSCVDANSSSNLFVASTLNAQGSGAVIQATIDSVNGDLLFIAESGGVFSRQHLSLSSQFLVDGVVRERCDGSSVAQGGCAIVAFNGVRVRVRVRMQLLG